MERIAPEGNVSQDDGVQTGTARTLPAFEKRSPTPLPLDPTLKASEVAMFRTRSPLLIVVLALLLGGCSLGRSQKRGPQVGSTRRTVVMVVNHHWSDMNVYAEGSGARHRLGTVTAQAKRSFQLPGVLLSGTGGLRLVADPIGGRNSHVSFPVQVWPGETVEFTIENQLATSSVVVR